MIELRFLRTYYVILSASCCALIVVACIEVVKKETASTGTALVTILSSVALMAMIITLVSEAYYFLRSEYRSWRERVRGGFICTGLITLTLLNRTGPAVSLLLILMTLLFVGISYDLRYSLLLTSLSGAILTGYFLRIHQQMGFSAAAGITLIILGGRIAGERVINRLRETSILFNKARWAASELSNVVMKLEESVHRARVYEIAKERRRVAREVHDTIGYTLTGLIVQIEVAARLVTNPVAKERLAGLVDIARKALQEVRREVSELRTEIESESVMSWPQRWVQACDYFSECTGVRVDQNINHNLDSVSGDLGEMFYRIIQEGLTNAYRHGEATKIDVSMAWKESLQMILFRISDNGVGTAKLSPGNGLNGIKERIEACGGTLAVDSLPGKGFDLGVDVPWQGP